MSDDLQSSIAYIKSGNRTAGQQLLMKVIKADPKNEAAWLWMASAVDDLERKKECLQKVLQINPSNEVAKKALPKIESLMPPAPVEPPTLEDTASKPAQGGASAADWVGSIDREHVSQEAGLPDSLTEMEEADTEPRPLRILLVALGGLAVMLTLCIVAMLVVLPLVDHEALFSVFGSSNPPVEHSSADIPAPTTEPYPPTWTPTATGTPAPTNTRMPTLSPSLTFTPWPTPTPSPPSATPMPSGSPFRVGDWELRVERVELVPSLDMPGFVQRAAGRFAVVFLAVTNYGLSTGMYVGVGDMEIQDRHGKRSEVDVAASGTAAYIYGVDPHFIDPDETGQEVLVFDIEKDAGPYVLVPGTLAWLEGPADWEVLLDVP